jgi:FADH2 O2-dependent halogenase
MTYDLVVVGAGFGGSILAMVARRLGRRVLLLERGRHPRFAIGESSSPLAGILIEQLAQRYDLPRLAPLASYGTWRRTYPHLTCGLKRGFTYYKHEAGAAFSTRPDRGNELLVAASPNDELADTHWLRADVDAWLVDEAVALGVDYEDEVLVETVEETADGMRLRASRHGQARDIEARGVVDATGPRGCLHRAFDLEDRGFDGYPPTQALFSHFVDVARCDGHADFAPSGTPPYPVDDAALHHVFDGGWMWVLRFGNGVTSAGVAVTDDFAQSVRLSDGADAWPRVLATMPSVAALFASARPIRPFTWQARLPYRASRAAGDRWALLPSAAVFVDPLFSTGFPLTLLGIERLGRLFERGLFTADDNAARGEGLAEYGRVTLAEADHTARFIAGCYASFPRFEVFTEYSMFYFAAASFADARRRLLPHAAPPGFLGSSDAVFTSALRALSPAVGSAPHLHQAVADAIEHMNIAGLCRRANANWYGVDNEDLRANAHRLGVSREVVDRMLVSLGCR